MRDHLIWSSEVVMFPKFLRIISCFLQVYLDCFSVISITGWCACEDNLILFYYKNILLIYLEQNSFYIRTSYFITIYLMVVSQNKILICSKTTLVMITEILYIYNK